MKCDGYRLCLFWGEYYPSSFFTLILYICGISDLYILYVVFHYSISLSEYLRCYGVKKTAGNIFEGEFCTP